MIAKRIWMVSEQICIKAVSQHSDQMWPLCIGISRLSAILTIQVFGIYSWDIGLSANWCSGVDDRISILPIFVCDIYTQNTFSSLENSLIWLYFVNFFSQKFPYRQYL